MNDCVFCKIINKEIPAKLQYEDSDVVVFNNNEPVSENHLLIVPKKHIASFIELDETVFAMTKAAQKIIKDLNLSPGYKLVFNGGKYQSVPHVHWHLLAGKLELGDDILNQT